MGANRWQMNVRAVWADTKKNVSLLGCHAATSQLGSDIVNLSNRLCVLRVIISSDLSARQASTD